MKPVARVVTALMIVLVTSCSSTPVAKPPVALESAAAPKVVQSAKTPVQATPTAEPAITIYSPYSTEGLLALNDFRSNNSALNDFLVRNRKPDYFFSGINTEFAYQKIYLVYLESENLYLFDSKLKEPYKKFHPLPESVKQNFKGLLPTQTSNLASTQPTSTSPVAQNNVVEMEYLNTIEKSLTQNKPEPYLNAQLLYQIPREGMTGSTLYPDLYFLDMPLSDLLENQYSAKYDNKKNILKLIFPKSYEAGILYKKTDTETRKIFVEHNVSGGNELSLLVPDFLPGSAFYQTRHGNISKVFSSLYQINVPHTFIDSNQLHMRYSIKLCQNDAIVHCAVKKDNATYVRAIVIEATLYDNKTKLPIETFVLK